MRPSKARLERELYSVGVHIEELCVASASFFVIYCTVL